MHPQHNSPDTALNGDSTYTVIGLVMSPDEIGIAGLAVQLVDVNVGADALLGDAKTDIHGCYQISVVVTDEHLRNRRKIRPDLQVRVMAGSTFLAESKIRYEASSRETLDITLSSHAELPSEYETLNALLAINYSGSLADLQENAKRQDITYLAQKVGWDARAIAFAALAEQFSRNSFSLDNGNESKATGEIHPEFYYALFRAGFPTQVEELFFSNPDAVGATWQQAIARNIIASALEDEVESALRNFRILSAHYTLEARTPHSVSTLKEMLQAALGDDSRLQYIGELYVLHQNDLPALWDALEKVLEPRAIERLRFFNQLGALVFNNAPLMMRLIEEAKDGNLSSLLDLVKQGYWQAAKWTPLIDGEIPEHFSIGEPKEAAGRYAESLAARLRIAFPTAVVAAMVFDESIPATEGSQVRDEVYAFLTTHQCEFQIGGEPIGNFLDRTRPQDAELSAEAFAFIQRLQRVYQITPSDQAFLTLLKEGIHSAHQVTRMGEEEFVHRFAEALGGEAVARKSYAKAREVHDTVFNMALTFQTALRTPALGSATTGTVLDPVEHLRMVSAEQPVLPSSILQGSLADPVVGDLDVADTRESSSLGLRNPTIEELFGSMDFCDCDECGSVLSPAAYLVNLLEFLDCLNFNVDPSALNPPNNPQTILFSRRPDLQHLALSCANTNTALPHIDLTNETLEHFVANDLKLAGYKGHDTSETAASDELLAIPQFVNDDAYAKLKGALFPPPLPYHRPLEMLRAYFRKLDVPLHDVMRTLLRSGTSGAMESRYGLRDILMEELGFSREEYNLLAPDLTHTNRTLAELYGYSSTDSDSAVIDRLSDLRTFSRRVGLTYDEVIDLLRTRFVNPNANLLPRLHKLSVPFTTLRALHDGSLTDATFLTLLPTTLDHSKYDNDVPRWVRANYSAIMSILTLVNPSDPTNLSSPADLRIKYSNPDDRNNKLTVLDFVRLLRFIRLRRKLDLTTEQTDDLINALWPGISSGNPQERLDEGFRILLPRISYVFKLLNLLQLTAADDLADLLACWAPIGTSGSHSPYRLMFLSSSMAIGGAGTSAFEDTGYGEFLHDRLAKLTSHDDKLRAAFRLTGDEFTQIIDKLGFDGTTPLTLPNISNVFRHAWLARALQLSVKEFLSLLKVTGLDPFVTPDPVSDASAEPDVIRLVRFVREMQASSLLPSEALSLVWNNNASSQSTAASTNMETLVRALRTGLANIDREAGSTRSNSKPTSSRQQEIIVAGLAAASGADANLLSALLTEPDGMHATTTIGSPLIEDFGAAGSPGLTARFSFEGTQSGVTVEGVGLGVYAQMAGISGVLREGDRFVTTLNGVRVNVPVTNTSAEDLAIRIAAAINAADAVEISTGLALCKVFEATAVGPKVRIESIGQIAQRSLAQLSLECSIEDAQNQPPTSARFKAEPLECVWSGFLGVPQDDSYTFTIIANPDARITLKLDGVEVAPDEHGKYTVGVRKAGALSSFELSAKKLTTVFTTDDGKENFSVKWEGGGADQQEVAATYLYTADLLQKIRVGYARLLKAASVTKSLALTQDDIGFTQVSDEFKVNGTGWLDVLPAFGEPTDSVARRLFETLERLFAFVRARAITTPNDKQFLATLKNPTVDAVMGLTGLDEASLNDLLHQFGMSAGDLKKISNFSRVLHAAALLKKFSVSAKALLASTTNDPSPVVVRDFQIALRASFNPADWLSLVGPLNDNLRGLQRDALVAYVLLHMSQTVSTIQVQCSISAVAGATYTLGGSASAPTATVIGSPSRGAVLTTTVNGVVFKYTVLDLNMTAKDVAEKIAASISGRGVKDPVTRLPGVVLASSVEGTVTFAFDSRLTSADQLFEFFLMDPKMEPCAQTSRIRHALSSVQLFIERVLRNLEPEVDPAVFSSGQRQQWEWMKRYRVWQANREVFLWPENWLDPQLREDQSSFFRDTMGELIQSDIDDNDAALAILGYLTKLEEVARLEPCGIHHDAETMVSHVVARTSGANRKYFYRRFDGKWGPWEHINLDIEDAPIIPVVWKNRIFLFWLRVLQQVDPTKAGSTTGTLPPELRLVDIKLNQLSELRTVSASSQSQVTVQAVLCCSEYGEGKWGPIKTSDPNRPTTIKTASAINFDRSMLSLLAGRATCATRNREEVLFIQINPLIELNGEYPNNFVLVTSEDFNPYIPPEPPPPGRPPVFRNPPGFVLFNTHSLPVRSEDYKDLLVERPAGLQAYRVFKTNRTFRRTPSTFKVIYYPGVDERALLDTRTGERIIEVQPGIRERALPETSFSFAGWKAPFFFADSWNAYHVRTSVRLTSVTDTRAFLGMFPGAGIQPSMPDRTVAFSLPSPGDFTTGPYFPTLTRRRRHASGVEERSLVQGAELVINSTEPISYGGQLVGSLGRLNDPNQ